MASLPAPRITQAGTNFLTGQQLGRQQGFEDQDRQTMLTAGEMASAGDLSGASKALFKGGQFDKGLATKNAISKMSDDNLARTLQVQDRLARLAGTIQTPEEFEMAKTRLREMGLPVPQSLTFEQLPQLRAEALSVADQMTIAMKERELAQKATQNRFGTPPSGYAWNDDGSLTAIPGGPSDPSVKGTGTKGVELEQSLRKEFAGLSKDYRSIQEGADRVKVGANLNNAVGDLSLIFGYMKLLDPGSVVREGEFANAENAQGVPDRIRNVWNKIVAGERLNPETRQEFVGAAKELAGAQTQRQNKIIEQFRGIAADAGLDPERIIMDFGSSEPPPPPPLGAGGQNPRARNPATGEEIEFNPQSGQWEPVR